MGILLYRAAVAIWAVAMAAGPGQMSRPCGNVEKCYSQLTPIKTDNDDHVPDHGVFQFSLFFFWFGKT